MTPYQISLMTAGYLDAIYFTDTGEDDQPAADTPLADAARGQALRDCTHFVEVAERAGLLEPYFEIGGTPETLGIDLWLTRNRHGAGFWDRGHGQVGDKLTELARAEGERYAYEGDDGRLYIA